MLDTVKPLPRVVDQVLERGVEGEGAALLVQPDEEIWKQSICRKPVEKLSLCSVGYESYHMIVYFEVFDDKKGGSVDSPSQAPLTSLTTWMSACSQSSWHWLR